MSKRNLPIMSAAQPCAGITFDLPKAALDRWNPSIRAASEDAATISVLDPVGYDAWTGDGVTAKRIGAALRSIGGKDVTVNINSPGGDMFEGLAIYNQLREYEGHVTVRVLGVAASAASIIAMAGDTVEMGVASFLMIHNCWIAMVGNKEELRAAAETIEPFDRAMGSIYSARTGLDAKAVEKLMTAESWLNGQDAIDKGFADAFLPSEQIEEKRGGGTNAARALDVALAKAGMPRSERRRLLNEIKGTPCATADGTPGAAEPAVIAEATVDLMRALARLQSAATQPH